MPAGRDFPLVAAPWPEVAAAAAVEPGIGLRKDEETFKAGIVVSLLRLGVWIAALTRFAAGALWDIVRGRGSVARRAVRMRQTIEHVGATFLKLGQQLSMRADLMPYEYVTEFERLLDDVPPFPVEEAVAAIERSTRRPLRSTFAYFNPSPIGSGSVACVYRAVLDNGRQVAVKVRRPGIGEHFAADIRVLGWLLCIAELYFLPSGFSANLLLELKSMLFEELNFTREARYTEIFRRQVREAGLHFVTSPRVHFHLSCHDVLVTDFVSGASVKNLVAAAEAENQQVLARLAEQGITLKKIARRVLKVSRFGLMEGLFFHADLHPANILVHPKGRLTIIDFGSCGAYTEKERRLWHRFSHSHRNKDVGDMVQAVLALLEPLPPIDLEAFTRRIEVLFWRDFYANTSRHAQWWERTSANLWLGFFGLAREYRVPINLNTLRMLRSTMLVDTLAARLYHSINHYEEYHLYERELGRRVHKRFCRKLETFTQPEAYIRYEQVLDAGMASLERLQRFLDAGVHLISRLELPLHFTISLSLQTGMRVLLSTTGFVLLTAVWMAIVRFSEAGPWSTISEYLFSLKGWTAVLASGWYWAYLALVAAIALRRIFERLHAKRR